MKFLSNDYTNPNANPKTLTALTLTLAELTTLLKAFVRRYFVTLFGTRPYFLDSESDFRTPRHFVNSYGLELSKLDYAARKMIK